VLSGCVLAAAAAAAAAKDDEEDEKAEEENGEDEAAAAGAAGDGACRDRIPGDAGRTASVRGTPTGLTRGENALERRAAWAPAVGMGVAGWGERGPDDRGDAVACQLAGRDSPVGRGEAAALGEP